MGTKITKQDLIDHSQEMSFLEKHVMSVADDKTIMNTVVKVVQAVVKNNAKEINDRIYDNIKKEVGDIEGEVRKLAKETIRDAKIKMIKDIRSKFEREWKERVSILVKKSIKTELGIKDDDIKEQVQEEIRNQFMNDLRSL